MKRRSSSSSSSSSSDEEKYIKEQPREGLQPPDPKQDFKAWVTKLFHRRPTRAWDEKEEAELTKVWKRKPTAEDIAVMEAYYTPYGQPYRRTSIERFLRNWNGELDQAIAEKEGVRKPDPNGNVKQTGIPAWKHMQILEEEISELKSETQYDNKDPQKLAVLKDKREKLAALKAQPV